MTEDYCHSWDLKKDLKETVYPPGIEGIRMVRREDRSHFRNRLPRWDD